MNAALLKLWHKHVQLSESLEQVTCQVTDFPFYLVHSITAISAIFPLMFVHSPVPFVVSVIFHIRIEPSIVQMTSSTR